MHRPAWGREQLLAGGAPGVRTTRVTSWPDAARRAQSGTTETARAGDGNPHVSSLESTSCAWRRHN